MSLVTLEYPISWHHIGNPDSIPLALAYGTLSLGAIILLEYIAAGILFSKANGILISDAAATVTFNNASWIDLGRWAFVNKPSSRICKRAVLAIFLRYFIIALDILILVVSLPRSIPVYEREVGSSVISFADRPISVDNNTAAEVFNAPCKPDPIEYGNFKPQVSRQLCMSTVFSATINQPSALGLDFDRNDVYVVLNAKFNRALMVVHLNSGHMHTYSHIMRRENEQFLLPPRPGIINEYWKRFSTRIPGRQCTLDSTYVPNGDDGNSIRFTCFKDPSHDGTDDPLKMFQLMYTRIIARGEVRNKYKNFNELVPPGKLFQIGTIDRPRVCIIPAVIMFLSLFLVACIVRFTKGKQDLAFKQWSFVSRAYGSGNVDNPLYSECSEFEKWNADGSISSFHQSNYTQDVTSGE